MVDMKVMSLSYYGNDTSIATNNFMYSNHVNDNMIIVNVPLIRQQIGVSVEQIIIVIRCNQIYSYSFAYIHV